MNPNMNTFDVWLKSARTRNDLERSLPREVNRLLTIYRSHIGGCEPMAGGCQHLMMKSRPDILLQTCQSEALFHFDSIKSPTIHTLPVSIKLYILSFLGPTDLCRCCSVSYDWYRLCNDELLWRNILLQRSRSWLQIYDDTDPEFYRRVCPSMPSKQIYLRCHPNCPKTSNSTATFLPNLFYYYITSTRPRFVMFGPGLETETSRLVRSILTDQQLKSLNDDPRFQVTGMVPGQFAGVGSGISLKLSDYSFNLITLYSNVQAVRQRQNAENRVLANKLFEHHHNQGRTSVLHEVKSSIQELLRKSQGFIFVVDATRPIDEISLGQSELFAMLCEHWAPSHIPLLVLACSIDSIGSRSHSAIDIVGALKLGRLGRRWMTQYGDVETLSGIRNGFRWLLNEAVGGSMFAKAR